MLCRIKIFWLKNEIFPSVVVEIRGQKRDEKNFKYWKICIFTGPPFFKGLFILCVHCSCLQTHQKRASDPITDGCEPPCGCRELNSGPLEEQSVLLTTEPSLQPPGVVFINHCVKHLKQHIPTHVFRDFGAWFGGYRVFRLIASHDYHSDRHGVGRAAHFTVARTHNSFQSTFKRPTSPTWAPPPLLAITLWIH